MMNHQAGGFIPPSYLLSPPASSLSSSATHVILPQARAQPLKAGSTKESELVRFLDEKTLHIQRRFAKRGTSVTSAFNPKIDVKGYESFSEAAKDVDSLVDLLWMSGTPGLQIPYLLSLALIVADFVPAFPAAARSTLKLLNKLDFVFASLLQGRNLDTGEILPGFESGRAVSITEKVRIKSLVEQTRIRVIRVLSGESRTSSLMTGDEIEYTDTDTDDFEAGTGRFHELDSDDEDDDVYSLHQESQELDRREINISKVYDRTMVELGDVLGGTPIGIITDD